MGGRQAAAFAAEIEKRTLIRALIRGVRLVPGGGKKRQGGCREPEASHPRRHRTPADTFGFPSNAHFHPSGTGLRGFEAPRQSHLSLISRQHR
ncbi:hypothetical protein BJS_05480 [Bradyrhizobium japonicum SEMIA 5079]|nr:hypothetical protein BJS_05480 [Bradyrhizobium japonicum SEMIA 5079]